MQQRAELFPAVAVVAVVAVVAAGSLVVLRSI
jgi:hypothetical protein